MIEKSKKIIICLLITLSTLSVFPTTNAFAGWNNHGPYWDYTDSNGSLHTGWLKDGYKWYYFDQHGYMLKGLQKINDKFYLLAPSGELWEEINTDGYFEITKGWTFENEFDFNNYVPTYSVTIQVPKKLYYDTVVTNEGGFIPLTQRTDDVEIFKTFISKVLEVADKENIPDDEKFNFLLAATLNSNEYKLGKNSDNYKAIESDPTKWKDIKVTGDYRNVTLTKDSRVIKYFVTSQTMAGDSLKSPIESFVEGCGQCGDSAILSAKIASLYGLDSLIAIDPNYQGVGHAATYVTGCKFADQSGPKGYTGLFTYNGITYGYASDFSITYKREVGSGFTMRPENCTVCLIPKVKS